MLTSTHTHTQDPAEISATTIAIDAAERRWRAALRDVARLSATGEVGPVEAAELESELAARYTALARELELRGADITGPLRWERYEARAAERRAAAAADRRRSPRLRGLSPHVRARREREMCVVASARVSADLLRRLASEDDEETLATRHDLAAAGLL